MTTLAVSSIAQAKEFQWGDWTGNWDNTVVYGLSIKGGEPDPALIGGGNGGTGTVILTDDGDSVLGISCYPDQTGVG